MVVTDSGYNRTTLRQSKADLQMLTDDDGGRFRWVPDSYARESHGFMVRFDCGDEFVRNPSS
jgi:hypothetical protein